MRVALIQCPQWSNLTAPYNIALLSACLKKSGHTVFCHDFNISMQRHCELQGKLLSAGSQIESINWYNKSDVFKFIAEYDQYICNLIDGVLKNDIQAAGFSIYDTSRWFSEEVARRIKKARPRTKIIFGGYICFREESSSNMLVQNSDIDAVCISEGEYLFPELLNNIESNNGEISHCRGFIYRDSNKGIVNCGKTPLIKDLNSLPFADFSDFNLALYEEAGLPISTSRGCINRCLFCEESILWGTFRKRGVLNIYEEIKYQLNNFPGKRYFYFNDSLINGDIKSLSSLADCFLKNDWRLCWGGQAVIRKEMDLNFIRKLYDAGLRFVSYGLESASQSVLNSINKMFVLSLAEEVIRNTKAAGISVSVNIIVGFPKETQEDIIATAEFLRKNIDYIDEIWMHPLVMLENSLFFKNRDRFQIEIFDDDKIKGWRITGEGNDFRARMDKLEFLKKQCGAKSYIPAFNLT